jgi:hypothetical protein
VRKKKASKRGKCLVKDEFWALRSLYQSLFHVAVVLLPSVLLFNRVVVSVRSSTYGPGSSVPSSLSPTGRSSLIPNWAFATTLAP